MQNHIIIRPKCSVFRAKSRKRCSCGSDYSNVLVGTGPYALSWACPSSTIQTIQRINPMHGIIMMSSIQPLFPVSCNLLTETAMEGMIIPTRANMGTSNASPARLSLTFKRAAAPTNATICKTVAMTTYPKYPHQYSDRDALPEKVAYLFLYTVVRASMNPIICCGRGLNAGAAIGCPCCGASSIGNRFRQSCISVVASNLGKAQTEFGECFVDVFFAQHHRGLDLDDIVEGSVCAQKNAPLPHGIDYC